MFIMCPQSDQTVDRLDNNYVFAQQLLTKHLFPDIYLINSHLCHLAWGSWSVAVSAKH